LKFKQDSQNDNIELMYVHIQSVIQLTLPMLKSYSLVIMDFL